MTKPVVLYDNLGPYHYARLHALSEVWPDLVVLELRAQSTVYLWESPCGDRTWAKHTLAGKSEGPDSSLQSLRRRVGRVLDEERPDVIVTAGYRALEAQAAARWAKAHQVPAIVMLESWKGSKRRWWLKERMKTWLVQVCYRAAFVGGWRQWEYARSLGFPEARLWRGLGAVDNQHFTSGAEKARSLGSAALQIAARPGSYFICVARLAPEKNLRRLLLAYKSYRKSGGQWGLLLAGDGPFRVELEQFVQQQGIADCRFLGWVSYDQLPIYYGLAGALVLPSLTEPWGLVVNEALASGIPVLVSRQCGCVPELCWDGINGYSFDPLDIDGLAKLMLRVSQLAPADRATMGAAGQRIVSAFTPETWASALTDCIRTVLSQNQS